MDYNPDLVIDEHMINKNRFTHEFKFHPDIVLFTLDFPFFFFKSSHNVTEIQFGLAYYFIESVLTQFPVEHLAFH